MGLAEVEPATSALSVQAKGLNRQIGIRSELPVRATTSHQKTACATAFGHALGTDQSLRIGLMGTSAG